MNDILNKDAPFVPPPNSKRIPLKEAGCFKVEWCEEPAHYGWSIVSAYGFRAFSAGSPGMSDLDSVRIKAFLDYWCFQLNMAYHLGHANAHGMTFILDPEGQRQFDELYKRYLESAE